MRATRAYLAGIGTAGALALGAALVFAAASAIIAFRGWPGAVGISGPARQVLTVTPPPSPVARRVAHVATTAKRTATTTVHRQANTSARGTAGHGGSSTTRGHRGARIGTRTQHQATTTPRTTTHPGQPTQPARHTTRHTHRGGPLHPKSYPTNTASTTSAPTTTPVSTTPTVTTAVATAPASTSATTTTPVGVKVELGHGHTVTITPTTSTPTTTTTSTTPTTGTSTTAGGWTITSATPTTTTSQTSTSPDGGN
jgi:hypothetical protein